MSEIVNFNKEFVERTKDVLERNYGNEEYEVTLLLNCLLGLVSFPIELLKDKSNKEAKEFQTDCVRKLEELIDKNEDYKNPNKYFTFRNIRNSIAHIGIEPLPYKNKIGKIIFISKDKLTITLKFCISVDNLYVFAKYVAEEYLKRFF